MPKYDVTLDSFSAEENTSGKTVVLKYCDITNGCANTVYDVPSLGDALTSLSWFTTYGPSYDIFAANATWANCKCTSKKSTVIGAGTETMLVTFSTEPAQDEYTEENLRIGGEWLILEENGAETSRTFYVSNNKFEGPYSIYVPVADHDITSYHDTLNEALLYGANTLYIYDVVGTVRADGTSFTGDGHWLLMGVDIQQIIDRNGDKKFRRTLQQKFKALITDGAMPYTSVRVGWNVLYDPVEGIWNLVEPTMYKTTATTDWPIDSANMPVI